MFSRSVHYFLFRHWNHLASRLQAQSLISLLALRQPQKMIDIGSGYGNIALLFGSMGHKLVCVDRDFDCLRAVVERANGVALAGSVTVAQCDATDLCIKTNSLPLVICNSVIEHGMELSRVMGEFSRVISDGGVLAMTTPNRPCRFAWRWERLWRLLLLLPNGLQVVLFTPEFSSGNDIPSVRRNLEQRFFHVQLYTEDEIKDALIANDFEVLEVRYYMKFLGAVLHDLSYAVRGMRRWPFPFLMFCVAQLDHFSRRNVGKGFAIAARRRARSS